MYGRESTVKRLLSAGANVEAIDKQGANALLLALSNNHLKTANFLIEYGITINTADQKKYNPLMAAVSQGSFELTKSLLEKGAVVNLRILLKKPH
jgi:ankyrin repeat protein